jgi:serine/threonine protein kinase/tetratricopeptide (TPR) repeat protein
VPLAILPGQCLGHYEVLAALGHGGMGDVYRARDTRLDRDVALKVLRQRLAEDSDARARFEREAKAIAALSHPNILAIYDFGLADGMPYSVTELLEGETLRRRLEAGALPWRAAAETGASLADALACAHARGIVHRDVKPENVFLTADGRVKLLDFGLARSTGPAALAVDPTESPTVMETTPGMLLGTIGYMAPEQVRGQAAEAAADVFALGCVLYEMVSGRRAFERDTPADTVAAILHAPVPDLSPSALHVPPALERSIRHCLEKQPQRRFRSAADVAVALRSLLLDSAVLTPSPRRRSGRAATAQHSVAVLPFMTTGSAADLDFLGPGIAENVINTISGLRGLRVVPRSIAFRFAGREGEPRAVGVELNAEALLSGQVTVRGDLLHVQADLVDTSDESQIWGSRFVRPAADLEAVAAVIAADICEALRGRFQARVGAPRRPRRKPAQSAAYREYLRGRHQWNRWTREGLLAAVEAFEAAIALDPHYAPAYAGLADAFGAAAYYQYLPPADALPRAREAAERAVALDPTLAEAHAVLGISALFFDWDLARAERLLSHAVALNPRSLTAQVYLSLLRACQARPAEQLEAARRAERIEPLSVLALTSVAYGLLYGGDVEAAETQLHRLLSLEADFPEALQVLAAIAESRGDEETAIAYNRRWFPLVGLRREDADSLDEAYREGGWPGYWQRYRGLMVPACSACPTGTLGAAIASLRVGDVEAALDHLERAVEERLPMLVFVGVDLKFVVLRGHPRFQAILRRIGLGDAT